MNLHESRREIPGELDPVEEERELFYIFMVRKSLFNGFCKVTPANLFFSEYE